MTPEDEKCFNYMKLMGMKGSSKRCRYRNLHPIDIIAIAGGAIDVNGIVSHEFDFNHGGHVEFHPALFFYYLDGYGMIGVTSVAEPIRKRRYQK